ncbi:tetratricopeptide repeat protein [Carboxylicivirga sp. A043]|uniref:tetratricopeptide repeat protein n=1 Tax=Carboxylicivirga litoralis TaxID=2816963 RepID=UPI0021CB263E|nr:tetratricopeptide repeat protein [Carboxylicivirga sp. A043]MCU4157025.1 tetratricopeptide repeat protein [Carboxylicivirga sp. A043]
MKKSLIFLFLSLLVPSLKAQDKLQQFQEYFQNGDTASLRIFLNQWQQESPKDAELYTCLFNYHFNNSRNEIITLNGGTPPDDEQVLILKDSTNQVAGFIGSQINYEESNLKLAFESINKGIELYPNRLDMRFGKIYVLGQIGDWRSFTDEIIVTVRYSAINKNQWTWTNNEPYEGGKKMFLSSLQDYQAQLYETMDDQLLLNMQEIAQTVLQYYPSHVESLSNLSIGYLVTKQYDKALEPLLKAERINPTDYIVLSNIAYAYMENGNKEQAISYYQKVLKYGDDNIKKQAEYALEQLNTNEQF